MKRYLFLYFTGILMLFALTACSTPQQAFYKPYSDYDGESNQHTRLICSPPEQIFDILTDPRRFSELVPEHTVVSFDTPPPYTVGTRLKININHLMKFTWHTRVEELVPDKSIRLTFLDGFFKGGVEIWELEPVGNKTMVVQTIIVQPRGWFYNAIWNLKARHRHNVMVEAFMDNLKTMAETIACLQAPSA